MLHPSPPITIYISFQNINPLPLNMKTEKLIKKCNQLKLKLNRKFLISCLNLYQKKIIYLKHYSKTTEMEEEIQREEMRMDPVPPMEFIYERVSVDASIQREIQDASGKYHKEKAIRRILKPCSGKFAPGTMTAILGPSGSGKTTLLNLLSGRLLSKNLDVRGRIKINGEEVESVAEFKSLIGYVMQEDLLMPTFTPKETFKFVADLRLPHKTEDEKIDLVENIIKSLGLSKCADTYVGDNLIRGISGGEKKRTSIGTELLINPSLVFLDQPTTGLDSTTALHVIRFLNKLSLKGRTVITTIHQPSSEIFRQFHKILLMLDGNIVYHGQAEASINYFRALDMSVPIHSNPMDHYMKIMNKEGIEMRYLEENRSYEPQQIETQFEERVNKLVSRYKLGEVEPISTYNNQLRDQKESASWGTQLCVLLKRNFLNILRNPLAIRAQVGQTIFFGVITIIIYERQSNDLQQYIQNISGLLNFITMSIVFAGVFSTINVFSSERPVFIRERLSNTYQPSSYFTARILAFLPLDIILPFLMIVISYFAVNLDNDADNFFRTAAAAWLGAFMSSAYGFLISALFSDPEVAMALIPVLVIPFLLLGGFYAPLENVHDFFRWIQYLSMFKYTYQSLLYAQFFDDENGFTVTFRDGVEATYEGNIIGEGGKLYVEEPYWLGMMLMALIGLLIRVLAFIALYFISNPKKLNLNPPLLLDEDRSPKKINSPQEIILVTNNKAGQSANSESFENLKKNEDEKQYNNRNALS